MIKHCPGKKSVQWFAQAHWIEQSRIVQNWTHKLYMADISQYIHEKLDEPELTEDEDCYCFSAPLDTCPEHGIKAKWREEHEEGCNTKK